MSKLLKIDSPPAGVWHCLRAGVRGVVYAVLLIAHTEWVSRFEHTAYIANSECNPGPAPSQHISYMLSTSVTHHLLHIIHSVYTGPAIIFTVLHTQCLSSKVTTNQNCLQPTSCRVLGLKVRHVQIEWEHCQTPHTNSSRVLVVFVWLWQRESTDNNGPLSTGRDRDVTLEDNVTRAHQHRLHQDKIWHSDIM